MRFRSRMTDHFTRSICCSFFTMFWLFVWISAQVGIPSQVIAAESRQPATAAVFSSTATKPALQPPDGKWLTDEQGRSYFFDRISKKQAIRVDEQTVRTIWATPIKVTKEDDEYYYFKVYKVLVPTTSAKVSGPDLTELKRIAATYHSEAPKSQKLQVTPFSQGLPTSGQWRQGFAIADMNGDGHLDIVHGPARKTLQPPVIFLGDGKGTWTRWQDTRYPALPFDYGDAQVGDLNGDGHPDLALGVHLRGLLALTSDGPGQFTEARTGIDFATNAAQGSAFSSQAIKLVDWNGDGRLDILALSEGPRPGLRSPTSGATQSVIVYLNNGDGSWTRLDSNTGSNKIFGSSLTVGDFNGDGRMDFATGSGAQGRKDIVNLGKADGSWEAVTIDSLRPTALIHSVVAGDFDHDGRDDLAVAYLNYEAEKWRTGIDIFYSRQDGQWQRRVLTAEEGQHGAIALGVGDVDGDQRRDLVALTDDGRVLLFPNDGTGFFSQEQMTIARFGNGCRGSHVALADLDGDGDDDIIASFSSEAQSNEVEHDRSFGDVSRAVCPTEGGIAAWKVTPRLTARRTR